MASWTDRERWLQRSWTTGEEEENEHHKLGKTAQAWITIVLQASRAMCAAASEWMMMYMQCSWACHTCNPAFANHMSASDTCRAYERWLGVLLGLHPLANLALDPVGGLQEEVEGLPLPNVTRQHLHHQPSCVLSDHRFMILFAFMCAFNTRNSLRSSTKV